jgi:hypothetical protein
VRVVTDNAKTASAIVTKAGIFNFALDVALEGPDVRLTAPDDLFI